MRQRITFLQEPQDSVDPNLLKVTNNAISTSGVKAAREDRITFGFDELPQELYRVLKASHELHVRWVGQIQYDTIAPLVSRLSPGLHVFYTPQRSSNNSNLLCPMLKKAFGELECISPEKSFTNLPIERFSLSAATQYYQPLPFLTNLIEYIKHKLCKTSDSGCLSRVSLLHEASSLDIDFDSISHALSLTAFFPSQTWDINLSQPTLNQRLEVGILSVESPKEPEELSLGGFLIVVGEDSKPSPTLFSFPSRHHQSASSFSSKFILPTGLHPTLELSISDATPPTEERTCSLHAHLTLPRQIFADKYQLSDPLFLASKNLSAIHYITTPVDLEAPTYAVDLWGSSVLLELAPPPSKVANQEWTAQIPLHLRYLMPNNGTNGQEQLEIPYPVLFWACTADEGSKFPINPFDRVNLGYDGLFGPKTMFYHLNPTLSPSIANVIVCAENEEAGGMFGVNCVGRLVNRLSVPVLDLGGSRYVEIGTAAAVGVGFLWVMWCLGKVWVGSGSGSGGKKVVKGEKKRQ